MALTALKGIKSKRKAPRAAPARRAGNKLSDPKWDGWEDWDGKTLHKLKTGARDHYYQNYKLEDLVSDIWEWMGNNEYTPLEIETAKKAKPNQTVAISCRMLNKGCPDFCQKEADYWDSLAGTMGKLKPMSEYVKKSVNQLIFQGKEKKEQLEIIEKQKNVENRYVPTIQERIREQATIIANKMDSWLDSWQDESFDPAGFNLKAHFIEHKVTQAHARIISAFYEPEIREMQEVLNPTKLPKNATEKEIDYAQQLKEGYSIYNTKQIKNKIQALQAVLTACDVVIKESKINRKSRKRKPKSAEKLVEKLKFLKTDDKLGLVSIQPTEIIGCNELWIYNVKTRKLGKYVASVIDPLGQNREGSGLSVKGTTITGFKTEESIQKTLRKPEEKLKEFADSGKVKLRTFLDDINAVDIKLNGRINAETILLRVIR